jgi:hypothetical protein
MQISTGLSEINIPKLNNNRVQNEKIYLWPLYDPGKIQNIREVHRHPDLDILYSKPSGEERDSMIRHYLKKPDHEYTASGSITQKYPHLPPGSLFNALV